MAFAVVRQMIKLPKLEVGDVLNATVNNQVGWLRVVSCMDGRVKHAQFIPQGTRQQKEVSDPDITNPSTFIRGDGKANTVFEGLMVSVGMVAAIHLTK